MARLIEACLVAKQEVRLEEVHAQEEVQTLALQLMMIKVRLTIKFHKKKLKNTPQFIQAYSAIRKGIADTFKVPTSAAIIHYVPRRTIDRYV